MARGFGKILAIRLVVVAAMVLIGGVRVDAEAFSPGNLRAAAEYSASHKGLSLLVIQNHRIIFEQYDNGHSSEKPHKIYSGTKAFWTAAAVAAEEDGILSLDERAAATLTEWKSDPKKQFITIRDLLNFTAGLDPGFHLHGTTIFDRNQYAIEVPEVAAFPGSRFIYGPASLQCFGEVLRRKLALRNDAPWPYLERRILSPLDLHNVKYRYDQTGMPLLASGFELSAREWARFGQMVLGSGIYRGRRILSPHGIESFFHGSSANPAFGLAFWLNPCGHSPSAREFDIEDMLEKDWKAQDWRTACICRGAPTDMVACIGSQYQRLFIFPSLNAVVVRQGLGGRFTDAKFLRLLLGI